MSQVKAASAPPAPRADRLTKGLLACGVLYAVTYIAGNDLIAAAMTRGYTRMDQAVSELSATGAAARPLLIGMNAIWMPAMVAFGVGVWRAARGNRWLRVTGVLLMVFGVTSLLWLPFPMTARQDVVVGAAMATNDLGHIGMTALTAVFILAEIASSAVGLGWGFRIYCAATVAVILVFGALTGAQAPHVAQGLPTPLMGFYERVNIGAWLLWMAVLAVVLWRRLDAEGSTSPRSATSPGHSRLRQRQPGAG